MTTVATANFVAEAVTRTGHLTFNAPPTKVFPLFTPEGERHWAAGWNPEILYPRGSDAQEGMLFRTHDHGGTLWWLTRYAPKAFSVGYHFVAPDGLARHIEVRCRAAGTGTEVEVTDTFIGLSDHGNEFVRSLDEKAYSEKMAHWHQAIARYLATGESPAR